MERIINKQKKKVFVGLLSVFLGPNDREKQKKKKKDWKLIQRKREWKESFLCEGEVSLSSFWNPMFLHKPIPKKAMVASWTCPGLSL